MATVLSSLYPPLVDTFQSPFLYTDSAKISFTISPYNSYKEITRLHITLVNQKTNQNVFATNSELKDGTVLTNGVWIVPFETRSGILETDYIGNYYTLTIPNSLLKQTSNTEAGYVCDCYYKVQIRIDNSTAEVNSTYLNDQRAHFSEWSAVTLLKAIPEITVTLTNFDVNGMVKCPQYTPGIVPFAGSVSFDPSNTGEHLESYKVKILDAADNVIKESGLEFVKGNINSFSWLCDLTDEENNKKYYVKLYLTTNNGYTLVKDYGFRLVDSSLLVFNPTWDFNKIELPYAKDENGQPKKMLVTSEDGWVTITVSVEDSLPPGYLFIKRANSLDKYLNWEIIDCTYFADGSEISTTFIDKTVGSLVNYRYSCQYLTASGIWSKTVRTNEIVYPDFHDALILRGDKQLAIRYNTQVSTITPVVNRVKVDTLGGKYPRFISNARMHYKQFQITGLLTAEGDYNRKFISDLDYQDEMSIYNQQMNGKYLIRNDAAISNPNGEFTQHGEYPRENWWWERKFREEAVEWLNDSEPKLYRSMTEGNLIVIFDAVSLTPNQQLGRRVWNFSATAYEVGDGYSLTELDSLGIFNIKNDFDSGVIDKDINDNIKTWQPENPQSFSAEVGEDPTPFIQSSLIENIKQEYSNYQIEDDSFYLNDVEINFTSSPQWYDLTNMNLKQQNNPEILTVSIGGKEYNFKYDNTVKQYIVDNGGE